MTKLGNLRIA